MFSQFLAKTVDDDTQFIIKEMFFSMITAGTFTAGIVWYECLVQPILLILAFGKNLLAMTRKMNENSISSLNFREQPVD